MSQVKREREWDAAASSAELDAKRPRLAAPCLDPQPQPQPQPMATLDAVRAELQRTADPHLQARLLLRFSACAASPGARTAAAIDFLFSFLQQNQAQTETQGADGPKDATGSGAIVVGAIVRGLRQLLAAKAAVVEPMIQVDAMGEQLMQCMSVGEDFKLRRDMLRIVVDCLMRTHKHAQVETLLRTCVQDHDAGMQAICLRGYLRLHDAGRCFASADGEDTAAEHFDRLAAFLLFSQSEEIRRLAAQVLVALAELHPQLEVADSHFFPSSTATTTLFLPEKAFGVLCMAGSDPSEAVRVEVARCLRGFSRVLLSDVVEHAVVKTQIDEAVVDVAPEVVEMNTRRMMSSGVLLSLLEDINVDVAAEASRTIARLSELAMARDAGNGRWSQRALERAITAHFDLLPRAGATSASQFCGVLMESLQRLLVCRYTLDPKTDFVISNADLNWLTRNAISSADNIKPGIVGTLLVLLYCDLSSAWSVQHIVDFLLKAVSSSSFNYFTTDEDGDNKCADFWDKKLFSTVQIIGKKCSKVLQVDVALTDQVQQEASRQHDGRHRLLPSLCRALLGKPEPLSGGVMATESKLKSNLFFLKSSLVQESHSMNLAISNAMDVLRLPPADGNITAYLKAIQRISSTCSQDKLDVSFRVAEALVRLRQHVNSFPDASTAPAPTSHSYVSMEAMLSTSPSVSSTHTTSNTGDRKAKEEAAQAYASLQLSAGLQKYCQEILDLALGVYVKAFALGSTPRTELLQLILLGRIGVVLGSLQDSTDSLLTTDTLRWIVQEATRLRFLFSDSQDQSEIWFPSELLGDINSLNCLKRAFVAVVRNAWPAALLKAAISHSNTGNAGAQNRRLAMAHASIQEPATSTSAKPEPREITANWPFKQHVRFTLAQVRDVTQIYVKTVLPNGDMAYHHIPMSRIRSRGPRKHAVDHTITLTVSPFSDPTTFTVAVCIGHPNLPGSVKPSKTPGDASSLVFTEISCSVRVPIFHRTSSTLRPAASRP